MHITGQHSPSSQMNPCIWVHFQPICLFVGVGPPKELANNSFWPLLGRKTFATNELLFLENIYFAIFSLTYSCVVHSSDSIGKMSFGMVEKNINK